MNQRDDNPYHQPEQVQPPLLLTTRQAAKALAICERSLWTMTQSGTIPCIRLGRSVRYDPGDLRRWIDQQKAGNDLTSA